MAQKFAKDRGTTLDETLVDRGLSGYSGVHRKKGHLGRFLERVERDEIPPGSILVIENTDRLSREPIVTALETFAGLLRKQIYIQTLCPYQLYTLEALNGGLIYQLIGQMHMAHDESAQKSKRITAARDTARKEARESGKILTAKCPAWLEVRGGQFQVIPDAMETIQRVFDMKLDGLGKIRITRALNASATWSRPNGWTASYVDKLLGNQAVIGIYQPYKRTDRGRAPEGEPIANYYPPIIDKDTFYAVQKQKRNRPKGRYTPKIRNLLTGIVKCAYCGGAMEFTGVETSSRSGPYLICRNALSGIRCIYQSIRYAELEQLILECCKALPACEAIPNSENQPKLVQALQHELQRLTALLDATDQQISRLVDQIANAPTTSQIERCEGRMQELVADEIQLKEQKEQIKQELHLAQDDLESFNRWQNGLRDLLKSPPADTEVRYKTRQHLREFIDQIDVYPIGYQEVFGPGKEIMQQKNVRNRKILVQTKDKTRVILFDIGRENLPQQQYQSEEFVKLVDHFEGQRMSKQGRFYRVFFRTDIWRDLVPEGSCASGYAFSNGKWKMGRPNFSFLRREYPSVDWLNWGQH